MHFKSLLSRLLLPTSISSKEIADLIFQKYNVVVSWELVNIDQTKWYGTL